jgi:hypothetical protein
MMNIPHGWLAFELNVLRRLKFTSVALPFTGEPGLGVYLKHWGVRVHANDLARWAYTRAAAMIENNIVRLSFTDVSHILEDAYVPRHRLYNPSLRLWFNETDAWWFDNVRENIEKLESDEARAIALSVGMEVGDYVLSFDDETRQLRQPLSKVFRQVWENLPAPVNNAKQNLASNQEARDFIAEQFTELLFLRLPRARNLNVKQRMGQTAWREDWVHGSDGFWDDLEAAHAGRLGTFVETKSQYLKFVEDLLQTAAHLPYWAVAHVEDGFVSNEELMEAISRVRKVDTVYTKDFSELLGVKATIITAH